MMHNHRPPLTARDLPAHMINLRAGEKRSVVCPDCGAWRLLGHRRFEGRIVYHFHGGVHCPGSGQRIMVDLTVEQWQELLRDDARTVASRRANRAVRRVAREDRPAAGGRVVWPGAGGPPTPVPVDRLARCRVA